MVTHPALTLEHYPTKWDKDARQNKELERFPACLS